MQREEFGSFLGGAFTLLKSFSGNYRPWVGKLGPLGYIQPTAYFVSKIVLGYVATPICLCNVYGCFPATTAEMSICDRGYLDHNA